jgi:hypothetical protein
MRGLDPPIHLERLFGKMDCRVKPGMTIFASKSMQADAARKRDDAGCVFKTLNGKRFGN